MLQAFIKLVAITLGTLILVFLGVLFIRWMGFQQTFRAPPHPWFDQAEWKVLDPPTPDLCPAGNVEKLVPNVNWIVALPVKRKGKTDDWIVPCGDGILISDYLKAATHKNWLLKIEAKDTWALDPLVTALQALDQEKKFAVMADSQKVSMYLRKKAPEWLYSADPAVLLRFRLFQSLWIDTAMDFWPDFVVTDFSSQFELDARGAEELKRRAKRVIWNKNSSAAKPPQVETQGVMVSRPE